MCFLEIMTLTYLARSSIIYNNSVVNTFTYYYEYEYDHRKRNVAEDNVFKVGCTVVQGDEYPQFKFQLFDGPQVVAVVNDINDIDGDSNIYSSLSGSFHRILYVRVSQYTSGIYWCESTVTGVFNTFIISACKCFL